MLLMYDVQAYGDHSHYRAVKCDSDTFIYEAVRRLWQSQCKEYEENRISLTKSAP